MSGATWSVFSAGWFLSSPNDSARPLLRTLQRELEDPLAENILVSRYPAHTEILVDLDKDAGKLTFSGAAVKEKNAVTI